MECKCICVRIVLSISSELIDTLWNVNTVTHGEDGGVKNELIDTLWNVNTRKWGKELTQNLELIDTLWNVN